MSDAILIEGVTKTFGTKVAVRDLDLRIREGGVYGFIGPNGAGKTTTIRMVMSILFPDRGRISVLGHDTALAAKDLIGYLPEERGVYRKMKVGSFLSYIAKLKGQDRGKLRHRVREWLQRVGMAEVENKRCEELSKGMQQKIQFISAVIHEPQLVILDEPFSGLDPVNQRLLRELIQEQQRRGATIIFSTHVMHQAEQICDHVVMIHDGLKVLDESLTGIRTRFDPRTILVEPLQPDADVSRLGSLPGVTSLNPLNGSYEIGLADGHDPATAMREIVSALPVARVELHRPSLEDVFVTIVTGATSAGDEEASSIRAALRENEGGAA